MITFYSLKSKNSPSINEHFAQLNYAGHRKGAAPMYISKYISNISKRDNTYF